MSLNSYGFNTECRIAISALLYIRLRKSYVIEYCSYLIIRVVRVFQAADWRHGKGKGQKPKNLRKLWISANYKSYLILVLYLHDLSLFVTVSKAPNFDGKVAPSRGWIRLKIWVRLSGPGNFQNRQPTLPQNSSPNRSGVSHIFYEIQEFVG